MVLLDYNVLNSIHGWLVNEEAFFLYTMAKLFNLELGNILEIGSWQGKSTYCLGLGVKERGFGMVYSIDTFQGSPGEHEREPDILNDTVYTKFKHNITRLGISDYVTSFRGKSEEAFKICSTMFDIIFIDAAHNYEDSITDLQWINKLRSGGLIMCHDSHPPTPDCPFKELQQAYEEKIYKSGLFKNLGHAQTVLFGQKI